MNKHFLIVVDMQNDFIDGSLGTDEAKAVVPAVVRRVRDALAAGETVVATLDTHGRDYMETREGKYLPVPHCIKDTRGWRLSDALEPLLENCEKVEKPAFASMRLPGIVEALAGNADQIEIELIGLCTDICVVSNALLLKAAFPEANIAVRRNCCAGVTPEKHEAALLTMASCQIDIL